MNNLPKRKHTRLINYDYAQINFYFITICTQGFKHYFGEVSNNKMQLNHAGNMIAKTIKLLKYQYNDLICDSYVVMPNHIHLIINIYGPNNTHSISEIICWLKTKTTTEYINGVKKHNWEPFKKKLWQRGFYDHVIRSQKSLENIRNYIHQNPENWGKDKFYSG